jgi:hypothetical protein
MHQYSVYNLTDAEKSLQHYKELGYGEINGILRKYLLPDTIPELTLMDIKNKNIIPYVKHITNIDSELKSNIDVPFNTNSYFSKNETRLPTSTILYRGLNNLRGFINEGILVSKAFSSCTTSIDVTKSFIDTTEESNDYCCILSFALPQNIKYYVYQDDNKKNREHEILLERNIQCTHLTKVANYGKYQHYTCIVTKYVPPVITMEAKRIQDTINDRNNMNRNQLMAEMMADDIDDFASDTD